MVNNKCNSRWRFAFKASAAHLGICLMLMVAVSLLVFKVWYPYPYYEMTGSLKLIGLIAAVDLVCGPLLTFVAANPAKPKRELMRDFGLIGLIQFAALAYGLYALAQSRPVALAFDKDRFYAVAAAQIEPARLNRAHAAFKTLPWFGMYQVGTRNPNSKQEFMEGVNLSLAGMPPSVRADWWLPRQDVEGSIKAARVPLRLLMEEYPARAKIVRQHLNLDKRGIDELYYLPLTSEKTLDWIMVMNGENKTIAYVPVDGFF